jgi:hypothetical protein
LAIDWLLALFATRRADAIRRYAKFVAASVAAESIWKLLNLQMFLVDDRFIAGCLRSNPSRHASGIDAVGRLTRGDI